MTDRQSNNVAGSANQAHAIINIHSSTYDGNLSYPILPYLALYFTHQGATADTTAAP